MFIYLANHTCTGGKVKCGGPMDTPSLDCVYKDQLCDGHTDCGNGWDEELGICSQFYDVIYV